MRKRATRIVGSAPADELRPARGRLDVAAVGGRIVVAGGSQAYSPSGTDDGGNFFPASYGDAQLVAAALTDGGAIDSGWGSGGFARALAESGNQITPATAPATAWNGPNCAS